MHAQRIGSRVDDEILISPGVDRRSNLGDGFVDRQQHLAFEMAASFRHHLVFDVHAGRTGLLEFLDSEIRIHRVSKTGVGVGHNGDTHRGGDPRGVLCHFSRGHQAVVGNPEMAGDDIGAGRLDRIEPGLFDQPGAQCIVRAGHNQNARILDELFQTGRFPHNGLLHPPEYCMQLRSRS
jgi:hypothetical protein